MQTNPQTTQPVGAPRRPALDMVSRRPAQPLHPVRAFQAQPADRFLSKKRAFDGLLNQRPALSNIRRQSMRDTFWRAFRRSEIYIRYARRAFMRMMPAIAPHKMLYGSLVGGVAFGMVTMATIEHYFGPGVFARSSDTEFSAPAVAGASDEVVDQDVSEYDGQNDIFFEYFSEAAGKQYEENIRSMVKGYPIEEMLPYILEKDRLTASFLIGIAKKESNWGKRVPVLDGQDCFNYWGYRGVRRMMGSGGHTCFNSRKDAVDTVAVRLEKLINSEKLDTPEKLVVWKCGYSCAGHSRESVRKWIADVDMYFGLANDGENEEE